MGADTQLGQPGGGRLAEVDEPAFSGLAERHRRELHVHCYRMLGSFEDAEDTVQETFLRAWRRRETFEGRSTFRAWLYRIATNACLDLLAKRRPGPATGGEVPWLQPYPDRLLDVRCSMPPTPGLSVGRGTVVGSWIEDGFADLGRLRAVPAAVNRQPAVAFYLWQEREGAYLPLTLDVLRIAGGAVAEIVIFDADRFPRLGLPERLPADGAA